jgi:hypothetical protein
LGGAVQHAVKENITSLEQISAIVLYWSKQDEVQARRCLTEVMLQIKANTKEKKDEIKTEAQASDKTLEKQEVNNDEPQKFGGIMPPIPGHTKPPESERKKAAPVKMCTFCGFALTPKRAEECYNIEELFTCNEGCAEKLKAKLMEKSKETIPRKTRETEKVMNDDTKQGLLNEAMNARPKEPEIMPPKAKPLTDKTTCETGLAVQTPRTESSIVRPLTQIQIIEAATSTAKLLADVVEKAKLYSMISGKKYTRVEGWETLGALLLCSSEIVKTEEYKNGYKAEAIIRNQDGKVISNGIGICLRSEKNWATRDDFAICSMSQTRAIGKAYRLGFAWIMSLAGYEVCPVEEME